MQTRRRSINRLVVSLSKHAGSRLKERAPEFTPTTGFVRVFRATNKHNHQEMWFLTLGGLYFMGKLTGPINRRTLKVITVLTRDMWNQRQRGKHQFVPVQTELFRLVEVEFLEEQEQ